VIADIQSSVAGPAGIPIAFLIGAISFFSPCVLPLVPGYLSYMSGVSGEELESGTKRSRSVAAALLFVLGFSIIFTGIGASATFLGDIVYENKQALQTFGGIFVIVMGVVFLSTMAVKPLVRGMSSENGATRRFSRGALAVVRFVTAERSVNRRLTPGVIGALPLGAAFAIGWSPCVGAGMGAILTLAAQERTPGKGAFLMFVFSLGFGMWFLLAALAFRKATRAFGFVRRHIRTVVVTGGALMIVIGTLMVTDMWDEILAPIRRLTSRWTLPI
jgi:cytochrome c-type biogenesis protein